MHRLRIPQRVSRVAICLAVSLWSWEASGQAVNLADGAQAIANPGTPVSGGGIDHLGSAYPADKLGSSLSWSGETFQFVAPGPGSGARAKIIPVPAAHYVSFSMLATGVLGNQTNQKFVATYTDGSITTFTQSLSDWHTAQHYQGESIVLTVPYRIAANGAKQYGTYNLYGYTFALNSAKTLKTVTLPPNPHVVALAIDVTQNAPALTAFPLSLTPVDNLYGIGKPGTAVTGGGIDGVGDAYAGDQLGMSLHWSGATFTFAAPGPGSAVTSKVIPLPAGEYISLSFLGTGVAGNRPNQTFVVTYTDGTSTHFTQSLSDWHSPQHYPGESIAKTTTDAIAPNGSTHAGSYDLYGYTLQLNNGKTAKSLTLPSNHDVAVLAIDATPARALTLSTAVPLIPTDNLFGISSPGTAVTGGGLDGSNDAYAADQLGSTLSWAGETFYFGPPGPESAVSGKVVLLPQGRYVSLDLLATGVDGNQLNQTFIVTYSDGSSTQFTRNLSDWHTAQHYQGESIAKTTSYDILPNGTKHNSSYNVYGYSLPLDNHKTATTLTLPNNRHVILLALDALAQEPAVATPKFSLAPGTYIGQQSVSVTDPTGGSVIFVTTDGSTPIATPSERYIGPIQISPSSLGPLTTTIKAIATENGFLNSTVASATYTVTLPTAATPTLSPSPDIFAPGVQVSVADASTGVNIFYGIDGGLFSPPPPSTLYTGPLSLQAGSISRVSAMASGSGFLPSPVISGTYEVPVFPSDEFPGPGNFLYNAYQDSCAYYQAIGALPNTTTACQVSTGGFFLQGMLFSDWLNSINFTSPNPQASQATFVNMMDLNFTRNHHAIWNGGTGTNAASGAYVCNYPGPDYYHDKPAHIRVDLPAVDAAIANALNGVNPLPCVAIDYRVVNDPNTNMPLNNGNPFMRFLVFDPKTGYLLSAVDLDGRGAKSIPNACSACHGVPLFASMPASGFQTSQGASYVPFDEANLQFSSTPGLTQPDQEAQIKALNLIILQGQNTPAGSGLDQLMHGWYDSPANSGNLASPTQQLYVPDAVLNSGNLNDLSAYFVYGELCRSCHVSNGVNYSGFPATTPQNLRTVYFGSNICNPHPTNSSYALMPNAKVTFDRFWTTHVGPSATDPTYDLAAFLGTYLNTSCELPAYYNPYPNQIP